MFVKSASVGRVRDPSSGEQQEKSAFIIFFAGDRSKTKIMKVWTTITDKWISVTVGTILSPLVNPNGSRN